MMMMMMRLHCLFETASQIARALISASQRYHPAALWNSSLLDETLHHLLGGDALSPPLVAQVIDPHLLHYPSLSLGLFTWAAHQPNFSHSDTTYHSLLKSLSLSRQFAVLEKLIRQANSDRIPVDYPVYDSLIAARLRSAKTLQAFLLFVEAVDSSIGSLGPGTCNSLLAGLASDCDLDRARTVFDEMLLRGVCFNTLGFGLFVWRWCCKDAHLNELLHLLDRVRESVGFSDVNGSVLALLVVHGLCVAGRALEAVDALEELRNRNCKPDFMAYRVVAESLRPMGCAAEVEMVLKRKRKLGVAPRTSDYSEFIFELISENRIKETKELGQVIVDGNFPIEDDVLNSLISSVSAIDPCSGFLFFNFMVGKERMPTLPTLTSFGQNLCRHGKAHELMKIYLSLSSNGYFIDLESYNIMLSLLCLGGRVREAYSVLVEMRKKGIGYDISSYNMLMEALCREDFLRPAKRLWDEMFANGISGNLETYNTLIRKFSEIGQSEEAQVLFTHMLDKGVTPDETTYVSIVGSLCRDEKIEDAVEILHNAFDKHQMLAQSLVSQLIFSLCKGGTGDIVAASKLLRSLNCDIQHAEPHVVLLKCLVDAREVAVARKHIKTVKELPFTLLEEVSAELLAIASSSSKPDPILDLIREVDSRNVVSSSEPSLIAN